MIVIKNHFVGDLSSKITLLVMLRARVVKAKICLLCK